MAKVKGPGRPAGAPNKGNETRKEHNLTIRCSEGFLQVLDLLIKTGYKGKSDVLHDAVQMLAFKKLAGDKAASYWVDKI